jgi:WD40 repeat protein
LALRGHADGVKGMAFSPDGRRLASASFDGTVKVWDLAAGQLVLTLAVDPGGACGVAFHPDGRRLAGIGTDGGVWVWEAAADRGPYYLEGHAGRLHGLTAAGGRLFSVAADRALKEWDLVTGQERSSYRAPGARLVWGACSTDGTRLAGAALAPGAVPQRAAVTVWDAAKGQELVTLTVPARRAAGGFAFSPDGNYLAVAIEPEPGQGGDRVQILDVFSGRAVCTLQGPAGAVTALAFGPRSDRLASAATGGGPGGRTEVKIWEVATGRETAAAQGGGVLRCLAFSPDGKYLAGSGNQARPGQAEGDAEARVTVWDAATGRAVLSLGGPGADANALAFGPDARYLAGACRDGFVRVWDRAVGREVHAWRDAAREPTGVAFLPGGRLAAGAADGVIRLWELPGGPRRAN